jgi:hypothetical protein
MKQYFHAGRRENKPIEGGIVEQGSWYIQKQAGGWREATGEQIEVGGELSLSSAQEGERFCVEGSRRGHHIHVTRSWLVSPPSLSFREAIQQVVGDSMKEFDVIAYCQDQRDS